MWEKAFRRMVLCASGALAVLFLPNALNYGLVQGKAPPQDRASGIAPATSGGSSLACPGTYTLRWREL